jgi:hypothetical protein
VPGASLRLNLARRFHPGRLRRFFENAILKTEKSRPKGKTTAASCGETARKIRWEAAERRSFSVRAVLAFSARFTLPEQFAYALRPRKRGTVPVSRLGRNLDAEK